MWRAYNDSVPAAARVCEVKLSSGSLLPCADTIDGYTELQHLTVACTYCSPSCRVISQLVLCGAWRRCGTGWPLIGCPGCRGASIAQQSNTRPLQQAGLRRAACPGLVNCSKSIRHLAAILQVILTDKEEVCLLLQRNLAFNAMACRQAAHTRVSLSACVSHASQTPHHVSVNSRALSKLRPLSHHAVNDSMAADVSMLQLWHRRGAATAVGLGGKQPSSSRPDCAPSY